MQRHIARAAKRFHGRTRGDIWQEMVRIKPEDPDFIRVEWMPSHLSETGKEKKRAAAIEQGLVSDRDIWGNEQADILAKQSLSQQALPAEVENAL